MQEAKMRTEQRVIPDPAAALRAFCQPFEFVYLLDVDGERIIPLKASPHIGSSDGSSWRWGSVDVFEGIVDERDLEKIREAVRPETVAHQFTQLADRRILRFRRCGRGWMEAVLAPVTMQGELTKLAIVSFQSIEAPTFRQDLSVQRMRIDLATGEVFYRTCQNGQENERELSTAWMDYYRRLVRRIHPDDRSMVVLRTHPSILKGLPDGDEVTCAFRSLRGSEYRRCFMALRKQVTQWGKHYIYVFFEDVQNG